MRWRRSLDRHEPCAYRAVGQERLRIAPDGQVVLELRRRWADGTTLLMFDPVELL